MKKYPNCYKDKEGKIFVKFSVDGSVYFYRTNNGKHFSSFKEAYDFVLLKKRSLAASLDDDEIKASGADLYHKSFEDFISSIYKETTAYCYIVRLRSLYPYFDKVKEFDKKTLIVINNKINEKTSSRSFYCFIANMYLDHLYSEGYFKKLCDYKFYVIRGIKTNIEKRKICFWDYSEFKKFLNKVDDRYYRLLFSFLYFYGLRISELLGLRWSDIDEKSVSVNLSRSTKTFEHGRVLTYLKTHASERVYPMLDFLYEDLQKIKKDSEFVFDVGETTVRRKLIEYIRKAHVKKITLHGFRHSCASYLINNGADYMQVCAWLGHSSPSTTLTIYSHIFPSRKEAIKKMFDNIVLK